MTRDEEIYEALHSTEWRELLEIKQHIVKNRGLDAQHFSSQVQVSLGTIYLGLARLVNDGYAERMERILPLERQIARHSETIPVYRRTEKEFKEQNYFVTLQPVRA